ncbi:START-like domain-containing protein, partial [Cynara cardunculus var. scolymus]
MDIENAEEPSLLSRNNPNCSPSIVEKEENYVPTDEDLKHLWHLVERKDGGPPWKHMMDRSTNRMRYQAWQRDPESGPTQYCTKTVYKNATPELMRDFRLKWDDMLSHAATVDEFPTAGASVVHWIRNDREYTISRRIWELEGSSYCVTKTNAKLPPLCLNHRSLPSCSRECPAHQSQESRSHSVLIFITKFGVRQGMWGAAKNVDRGFRSYQKERANPKTISVHVVMAQMSTKIDENHLHSLESDEEDLNVDMAETQVAVRQEKWAADMVPKLLVIGGAIMWTVDKSRYTRELLGGLPPYHAPGDESLF